MHVRALQKHSLFMEFFSSPELSMQHKTHCTVLTSALSTHICVETMISKDSLTSDELRQMKCHNDVKYKTFDSNIQYAPSHFKLNSQIKVHIKSHMQTDTATNKHYANGEISF